MHAIVEFPSIVKEALDQFGDMTEGLRTQWSQRNRYRPTSVVRGSIFILKSLS